MTKKQINRWIYILANLLRGAYIQLIGMISVTELFVLFRLPQIAGWTKKNFSPELKRITILYTLLLFFQIIAELATGNTFTNMLKGIMVTVMSYAVFLFYFELLTKDFTIVRWEPIATIVSLLIFGDQFGYAETGEATYFKFYLAPILIRLALSVILFGKNWIRKNLVFITGGLSLLIIIGGARSLGFSLLLSTIAYFLYNKYDTISLRKILPGVIVSIIVFQSFYAFIYVPKVSSGEWGSIQNREQLARIDNSKNVLMMILAARADFFVSWQAFMDKPIWGHGAWTQDNTLKYFYLLKKIHDSEISSGELKKSHLIPVHSVVVGMGTQHGIFKFITFLVLFIYMFTLGIKALNKDMPKEYNFYLIYWWIYSVQHLLFGPPAVLKTSGSIAFALFLAFYSHKKQMNKLKNVLSLSVTKNHQLY